MFQCEDQRQLLLSLYRDRSQRSFYTYTTRALSYFNSHSSISDHPSTEVPLREYSLRANRPVVPVVRRATSYAAVSSPRDSRGLSALTTASGYANHNERNSTHTGADVSLHARFRSFFDGASMSCLSKRCCPLRSRSSRIAGKVLNRNRRSTNSSKEVAAKLGQLRQRKLRVRSSR